LASTKSNLNPLTTILEQKRRKKMATELEDVKINVKIKLSALWATLMFLYIYADLLGNMEPGHIEGVISGGIFVGKHNINGDSESYGFPVPNGAA